MFNLEQDIKAWRTKLEKHPGLEPGFIEELEAHLRDKVEALEQKGHSTEKAFSLAVQKLEDVEAIAEQFHASRSDGFKRPDWQNRHAFISLLPNFLKITLRNFQRKKGYTFINVFGLAAGLAACLLMFLYINRELSFDKFHTQSDRIYRVQTDVYRSGGRGTSKFVTNGWPVGLLLASDYPEVEKVVNIRWAGGSVFHENEYHFHRSFYANNDFLQVFDFNLLEGNPATALAQPWSIVLTRETAQKYFGSGSVVGNSLVLNDSLRFTVTGVLENIPETSHMQFDMLLSFSTWSGMQSEYNTSAHWLDLNMFNYIMLRPNADPAAFQEKIEDLYMQHAGDYFEGLGNDVKLTLEPLDRIYLHSEYGSGLGPSSNISYVYLLGAIAAFILIIACINFMNLATARSLERAKEVGIRKAVGSGRETLIGQFLTESTLTTIFALVLALGLAAWALPLFNGLTDRSFEFADMLTPQVGLTLLAFIVTVGLLAGLYPALVLSGFRPVQVLKGNFSQSGSGTNLRKTLVVFQFAVSCFLIICTLVIMRQLSFMQQQSLGFDKEQILVMDLRPVAGTLNEERLGTIKQSLLNQPAIRQAAATLATPGRSGWRSILAYGEGQTQDQTFHIEYLPVDYDYIPTFGLKLIAGRGFSEDRPSDADRGVVINRAAVASFGWGSPQDAIGKRVKTINSLLDDPVIGVVENYHHHSLQESIQPLVMVINPDAFRYIALKFDPARTSEVLGRMQSVWDEFFPGYSFSYFFLDQDFEQQYQQEEKLATIYGTFATLAILIACLGLFGLATFSTQKRTKEIGIRKVLGASVFQIIMMIAKEFTLLIGLAFVVAAPLAWWVMQDWLEDFAYRTEISAGLIIMAGILLLATALLTISGQSIRAGLSNPVKSLRSE